MKLLIALFTLPFFVACNNPGANSSPEAIEYSIDQYAGDLLEDARFHSVSVAVYKSGESFVKHYGELEIGKGDVPTNKSVYELGSVTKTFTGMLAAKAVLDGKINLDDDVRKYLDRSYPNLEYKGEAVKIRHLLTHTSNFPNFPIKGDTKSAFFEGLAEISMDSVPGNNYSYSNTAPELMAYILEQVYQKTYDDLLQEFILNPQGMNDTAFFVNSSDTGRELVRGYNKDGELMPNFQRNLWGGTVGLNSTSSDLLKYMQWQLDEGNDVIRESHKKLFEINRNLSIAYHWYIHKQGGVVSFRHHGGIYGMQNWLIIYPEYDLGISVISNASFDGVGDALENIATKIFKHYR